MGSGGVRGFKLGHVIFLYFYQTFNIFITEQMTDEIHNPETTLSQGHTAGTMIENNGHKSSRQGIYL